MFRRLFVPGPRPGGPRRRIMRALHSPNPNVRRRAINFVGTLRDPLLMPQALRALELVAQNDPLPELRRMAQAYANQKRPLVGERPGPAVESAPQDQRWDCAYCGTRDNVGGACPNCAAPRP